MKERQAGIDLVRCTGLLFVVGVHSFLKNGFYFEPQTGMLMWLADSARWLFFCCNGIFMMLTGYLKSKSRFGPGYYRGLWAVLLGYVMTCIVSFPVRHFWLGEPNSLTGWVEKMLKFDNYGWYVEMYIGLILISPLINPALERAESRQLLLLSGTMMLLTALPGLTAWPILPDYWTGLYPLTYYVLGAAVRKWQPKLPFWLGILLTAALALAMGAASVLSTDEGFSNGFTQGYGGLWTTVLTVLVFVTLYRLQPGKRISAALAWMAGGVFEGYILSRLLDVWVYEKVSFWHSPEYYPLVFLCVTIPVFFTALLMGKLVHWPVDHLMRSIKKKQKRQATTAK